MNRNVKVLLVAGAGVLAAAMGLKMAWAQNATAPATASRPATAPGAADPQLKAKLDRAKVVISTLEEAIACFKITTGRVPTTEEGLEALIKKPKDVAGAPTDWPMIEAVPKDPWGHPYVYRCPPLHGIDYDLLSLGPDGKEGGGDDITSWQP